jgi:hypothetical protein
MTEKSQMSVNLLAVSELAETNKNKLQALPQSPKIKSQLTAWTNLWNFLNDPGRPEIKLTANQKEFLTTELNARGFSLANILQPAPKIEDVKIEIVPVDVEKSPIQDGSPDLPTLLARNHVSQILARISEKDAIKSERPTQSNIEEMNTMLEKLNTILAKYEDDATQEYVVKFCRDTLDRIKKYGKNTRFTEKQIAFIDKFYNAEDKKIGKSKVTVVANEVFVAKLTNKPISQKRDLHNQERNWDNNHIPVVSTQTSYGNSTYAKHCSVVNIMWNVITDDDQEFSFRKNVVFAKTFLPDYDKFNDYTEIQITWLLKLMTIKVIIEQEISIKKMPIINQILEELYDLKANPSDIKLSDVSKAHANLLLDQYKQHPTMLRLKNVLNSK